MFKIIYIFFVFSLFKKRFLKKGYLIRQIFDKLIV